MANYTEQPEITLQNHNTQANVPRWLMFLFGIYIFLSYFETYFTKFVGSNTKFYLLGLIIIFLYIYGFKIRLNSYNKLFIAWFLFKFTSLLWSSMTNSNVSSHFLSQIGMVLFLVTMTGKTHKGEFLNYIIRANYWCSFLFGIFSIVFQASYISEVYAARKVLTLWGLQNDPNNCAAFLIVGFMLAVYSILYERKLYALNMIVALINIYAIMLTASRAGLIAVAAIIILLVLLPVHKDKLKIVGYIKRIFIVLVVAIISLYVIQNYLPQASLERLFAFEYYSGGSSRSDRWSQAISLFREKPFFGWGWGGYILSGFGEVSGIHNTFITSLCDGGVVGTFFLVFPVILLSVKALRKKNNLIVFLLACGLFPAFFIDAINKRFFWNAIVVAIMLIVYQRDTGHKVGVWKKTGEDEL